MADGTQQNPLRDMITALGSLSEMAHIFYTGMKGPEPRSRKPSPE